ncbi:PREDICTED: uncharacterized protein LOC106813147 [Priapulus caudatus]|uniref:Uncharacterized protein LOC106813147 n=1 Tax=Priapulus caudatus TaxID=37621 RepID=A0ABM1EKH6_PRICU|nr:PREDICTED: uncharacterized protein LOC106813147 [Priapulus caudatus]
MLNGMHSDNCKPLQISNFDAVGFDLDHTLCKYNLVNLFHLTYDIATNHLVEKYHYPQRLLRTEGGNHKLYDFYFKGLQLDVKRGNFLKLSQNGHILRASHGTRMLNDEDIIKAYGRKRIWSDFENYKKSLTEHGVSERLTEMALKRCTANVDSTVGKHQVMRAAEEPETMTKVKYSNARKLSVDLPAKRRQSMAMHGHEKNATVVNISSSVDIIESHNVPVSPGASRRKEIK